MLPPYARYAAVYDLTGQHRFGAILTERVLAWLSGRDVEPRTALDLATGTGTAALTLAGHGVQVIGLDRSSEMLAEAQRKSEVAGRTIDWRLGDMRDFRVDEPVDLVVCFFDSMNYLLEEAGLRACFHSAHANLKPGGWFVFDINPIRRYATDWNDSRDIAYFDDRLLCLFRSTFDPHTHRSPLVLTVFEREPDDPDCWRRWEETHIERGYPLDLVTNLLESSGLFVEEQRELDEKTMQFGGRATESSMRAVFFTRRPDDGGKIAS